jgi:biopolymer transport protein ExbD
MDLATRKRRLRQTGLWCSLEISGGGFASLLVALLMIMIAAVALPKCDLCRGNVDLPKTDYPTKLPGANREDALIIAVQRDGSLYLGMDKITERTLPHLLQEAIRNGAERKAYIKADARAKYGAVTCAVDAVRDAGIESVGLLTEQRPRVTEPFGVD